MVKMTRSINRKLNNEQKQISVAVLLSELRSFIEDGIKEESNDYIKFNAGEFLEDLLALVMRLQDTQKPDFDESFDLRMLHLKARWYLKDAQTTFLGVLESTPKRDINKYERRRIGNLHKQAGRMKELGLQIEQTLSIVDSLFISDRDTWLVEEDDEDDNDNESTV